MYSTSAACLSPDSTLHVHLHSLWVAASDAVLAEILLRSPRFFFFYYHLTKYSRDQSIQKIVYLILKTEALVAAADRNVQKPCRTPHQ